MLKKYTLIVFLIISALLTAQSKKYYVDSYQGDDSKDGLSPASAWKTLYKVNSITYQPGDTIAFKSGALWIGQLTPKGSGTAEKPIVIDKYGGDVKPKFDGNGVTGKGVLYLVNQEYWEVTNLEITNNSGTAGDRRGVLIAGSNGGLIHHVYLRDLIIHDIKGIVGQTDNAKRTGGIGYEVLADDNLPTRFDDMLIERCTIYNVENTGLYTDNPSGRSDYPQSANWTKRKFTNFNIRNNVIHHVAKNAMIIRMFEKGLIEFNTCYETALQLTGNTMYTASCDGTVFQFNEGYLNRSPDVDGSMYDADLKSPNTVWQYSYSHDNAHGLMWFWTDPLDSGIIVRYNISQNDKGYLVAFRNDFKSAYVYNNVFYIDSSLSPAIIMENSGQNQKYTFANNIIYNQSASAKYTFGSAKRTIDYNLFYGRHPLSEPNDNHKLLSNPMFVNPGSASTGISTTAGYKIRTGSPCVNSGMRLFNHCSADFWQNFISETETPDRGVHEFGTVNIEPSVSNSPSYEIFQNYPNPFNPETMISFSVQTAGHVSLAVYDQLGCRVCSLAEEFKLPGRHTIVWNGRDDNKRQMPSGIYICKLSAGTVSKAIKMVLIK